MARIDPSSRLPGAGSLELIFLSAPAWSKELVPMPVARSPSPRQSGQSIHVR